MNESLPAPAPDAASLRPGGRMHGLTAPAARLLTQAGAHLDRRDVNAATTALQGVLALAPDHPEVLRLWSVACVLDGRAPQAVAALRRALQVRPDDALLYNNLGSALRASGDIAAAIEALQRACALAPTLAAAWYNLGKTLKLLARTREAEDALARAVALAPGHASAWIVRADTQKALGRIDVAERMYRHALQLQPGAAQAWWGLANLKTMRFDAADTQRLQDLVASRQTPAGDRAVLGFALGKAFEDQDRPADAWTAYGMANRWRRDQQPWDADAFSQQVDRVLAAFADAPAGGADTRGCEVIFIVSLPRSGSTLVEQIIASHPQVEGGGELPDLGAVIAAESLRRGVAFPVWVADATAADWERLGHDYLARTARWRVQRPRFTDKALDNWLYLGAAAAMLPGACFVHCQREPLETALSCYRQWFNAGQRFSYAIDDIASYIHDHARLMVEWNMHWPRRIHIQRLESLQSAPEANVRSLLASCALPFDARCLAFDATHRDVHTASAAQVRMPLQRSTQRASRYGDLLNPLRAALDRKP